MEQPAKIELPVFQLALTKKLRSYINFYLYNFKILIIWIYHKKQKN